MVPFLCHALRSGLILAALLAAAVAVPPLLHAQQVAGGAEAAAAAIDDERLALYAAAFAEVSAVRDEMQARLADVQNKTTEALTELRETLRTRVAEAIASAGLTEEEYQRITWLVSVDGERRGAFERMLAERPAGGPGAR